MRPLEAKSYEIYSTEQAKLFGFFSQFLLLIGGVAVGVYFADFVGQVPNLLADRQQLVWSEVTPFLISVFVALVGIRFAVRDVPQWERRAAGYSVHNSKLASNNGRMRRPKGMARKRRSPTYWRPEPGGAPAGGCPRPGETSQTTGLSFRRVRSRLVGIGRSIGGRRPFG